MAKTRISKMFNMEKCKLKSFDIISSQLSGKDQPKNQQHMLEVQRTDPHSVLEAVQGEGTLTQW